MRYDRERHRVAALTFLSNIQLDGPSPLAQPKVASSRGKFDDEAEIVEFQGQVICDATGSCQAASTCSSQKRSLTVKEDNVCKAEERRLCSCATNRGLVVSCGVSDFGSRKLTFSPREQPSAPLSVLSILSYSANKPVSSSGVDLNQAYDPFVSHEPVPEHEELHNAGFFSRHLNNPSALLAALRPSGDEEVSFAHILKARRKRNISRPCNRERTASTTQKETLAPECSVSELCSSLSIASSSSLPSINQIENLAKGAGLTARMPMCHYLATGSTRCPYGHVADLQRISTSSANRAVQYGDPLSHYDPHLLDDPRRLVATEKHVLSLPNYLTSIIVFIKQHDHKRNINRHFHENFPAIQLTLSKLRSLKTVLLNIAIRLKMDIWVVAHAMVLFEKIVLKLYVNHVNRKCCAGACLLISAKLNDFRKSEVTALVQELENNLRISEKELFQTEVSICVALEFNLVPPDSDIIPHQHRLFQAVGSAPPVLQEEAGHGLDEDLVQPKAGNRLLSSFMPNHHHHHGHHQHHHSHRMHREQAH